MKVLALILAASMCPIAYAEPVEIDTDAVHIVIVRPLDNWSADASNAADRLDALREKKAYYGISVDDPTQGKKIHVNGGAQGFGHVSKHPIAQAGREALLKNGFTLSQDTSIGFDIEYPVALNPEEWMRFAAAQSENYKQAVIAQGDPITLQSRTKSKKFFGGLLAVATMAAGVNRLGATAGLNATLGSGIANDAYRLSAEAGRALGPIPLPGVDLSMYKSIDVRRITNYLIPTGQLIFAYKGEKTPEAELEAILAAIPVIAGAGTTPEAVEQSRRQDFAARSAIWSECVAAGRPECKAN